jgi:quercetin dioxygenase-like cupin family protein
MGKQMKKIFFSVCLISFLASFAWAQEEYVVKTDVLAKTGISWDGRELPEYPKGKPEITILKIKIPPKTKLPLHTHPVINAGVLLKGSLTVVTEENEKLYLKAGDPIIEVVNKWHYGINESNEFAEIIVFYAGVHDSPITIKE